MPITVMPHAEVSHPGLEKSAANLASRSGLKAARCQNYEALVKSIGGIIWEADPQTLQFQAVSPQAERLLGYPLEQWFVPDFWLNHLYSSDRELMLTTCCDIMQGQQSVEFEYRMVAADGRLVWIKTLATAVLSPEQPALLHGVMLDITQQKHSETSLRQSQQFLQTVLDNLPVAVMVKDGRQERFGTYTFWNKASELLFGLTAEQAIGKTVYDCFPEEQADFLHQQDQETFNRGVVEEIFEAPTGPAYPDAQEEAQSARLVHTVKVPIYDEQHSPQYLLCISEDVTEQRQVEETLRQQAEREALIGAITNDIRQSLDLKQILNTTVAKVRQLLQVDRVLIIRFRPSWSGVVLVESVEAAAASLIGKVFPNSCFDNSFTDLYQQGRPWAISDITTHLQTECELKLFQELHVRASLTVPIQKQGNLWGLLIAQHCHHPRHWQPFEIDLLNQLSIQVGIAIEQSELYQQVQRLNADLERQVQIRTAELQLASEFEATLKRITDRVRDSMDEDQILQTVVRELAVSIGVTGCNAALYDLENRTSKVSYEYTDSLMPLQGRVVQMDNFPEGYQQLMQGQYFQFCSLVPNPMRGYVSMLACPILDDQGVLGDLWLVSQKYRAYNEQDIRLVQQVANQCAIAIRQARLYQKAQAQVKELEKLNRLKDDFLSTVSHELRTPMSNIKMATQMLEVILFRDQAQTDSLNASDLLSDANLLQKSVRYFQILKDECQREINLINDLLDLARLETGADVPTLTIVDLTDWLSQLVQPFLERAQNQQQVLTLNLPDRLPPIRTDLSRLERILAELLNNACKYTPAREQICLTVQVTQVKENSQMDGREELSAVLISQGEEDVILHIAITNSGVEISPEELTRIFDKFYRIPKNDPWRHGGTGLGLALVKKLLEPLNGTIQATSEQGLTTFMIQLPLLKKLPGPHQISPLG